MILQKIFIFLQYFYDAILQMQYNTSNYRCNPIRQSIVTQMAHFLDKCFVQISILDEFKFHQDEKPYLCNLLEASGPYFTETLPPWIYICLRKARFPQNIIYILLNLVCLIKKHHKRMKNRLERDRKTKEMKRVCS